MRYMRQIVLGVAFVGLSLGGFAACVGDDSSGNPDATTDGGGTDATMQDVSQDMNQADGPTGCEARTVSDAAGVFVAQSGSDVNSCGTRGNPCRTITYAIATAKATSGKATIYVARPTPTDAGPGVYAESITLDAPLTIEGGWADNGGTWTPICDATTSEAVTIQGTSNITLSASFAGSATLRDVRITSKAADPGESLYGIFATGSATNLTLDQVVVDIGPGGAGAPGGAGVAGASTTDAGCPPGNGGGGSTGGGGPPGAAGAFSPTGYVPTNGGDGGAGGAGQAGTAGGIGQCMTGCDVFTGSCATTCGVGQTTQCAQNGLSGCAGGGGAGGSFGSGGGASVAVYAWDAHVVVFGGRLAASNGGNGGNGGAGGAGGSGAAGAVGSNSSCDSIQSATCVNLPTKHCTGNLLSSTPLTGGTSGGAGGVGGAGGHGGGGSGGDSYAIIQGGDAGVTLNGSPALVHGDGGAGGTLGGANGTAGDKWP